MLTPACFLSAITGYAVHKAVPKEFLFAFWPGLDCFVVSLSQNRNKLCNVDVFHRVFQGVGDVKDDVLFNF
jgi:hypothetical protein